MKACRILFGATLFVLPFLAFFCSPGTSETGNAHIELTGSIVGNNHPVANAQVQLVPDGFVPGRDALSEVFTTRTVADGSYRFTDIPAGDYYLNANSENMSIIRGPVTLEEPLETFATDTLLDAAELTIEIPKNGTVTSVYIEGSTRVWDVGSGTIAMHNVPSGKITIAGITNRASVTEPVATLTVDILPGDTINTSIDNKPPVITSTEKSLSSVIKQSSTAYSATVAAYDPEGGALSFSLIAAPEGMEIDTLTGSVTWQPGVSTPSSTYRVGALVSDNGNGTRLIWWNVGVETVLPPENRPPVITLAGGDTIRIPVGDPDGTFLACLTQFSVVDEEGDVVTIASPETNADIFHAGTYSVIYSATDTHGNTATKVRYVIVKDDGCTFRTLPIINIRDTLIVTATDAVFTPPIATAIDGCGSDLSDKITVSGAVTIGVPGTYLLTYSVTDAAANRVTKKVVVIVMENEEPDRIMPVIILSSPDTIFLDSALNLAQVQQQYREPGYSAVDDRDADITARVIVSSISLQADGNYVVTYNVSDKAGNNAATVKRIIIVDEDASGPVITLSGNNPDTVTVDSTAVYNAPAAAAFDKKDGDITFAIVVSGTVDMKRVSAYALTYRVADSDSNVATAVRIVYVVSDTGETDLRMKYGVPSPYPIPDLIGKTYFSATTYGTGGPDLSMVDSLKINWDLAADELSQLQLFLPDTTRNLLQGHEQSMARPQPFLQPGNGGIAGLGTTLYIAVSADGSEMYWVDRAGKYAIVWRDR